MAIETLCSGCGQTLAVPDQHAGKRARCPDCGQIYTVPYPTPADGSETDGPVADSQGHKNAAGVHPSLASTTAGNSPNGSETSASASETEAVSTQFWMQTSSGDQYGPVDRVNLNRWFEEGRVGQGYQIRQGENGPWLAAELFQPRADNPYGDSTASQPFRKQPATTAASDSPYSPSGTSSRGYANYAKADPSGFVLTMGILSWIFFLLGCVPISWIPGLLAWMKGGKGLQEIRSGIADPTNASLVQVGYYLGMVNVIVTLLGILAIAAFIAVATVAGVS